MRRSVSRESEPFTWPLESTTVILTGTHSSGKSTLLTGLEQGKLTDLDTRSPLTANVHVDGVDLPTDDLGYGVLNSPEGQRFIVTVPETARWLATILNCPDMLAENYTIEFQRHMDELSAYRLGAAVNATSTVMTELQERGLLMYSSVAEQPLIISDRGPFDGDVYSKHRMGAAHTDSIGGFPWAGRHAEWTRQQAAMVIISDETEVPFEKDAARLDDADFRKKIAQKMLQNYRTFMPSDSVSIVSGSVEERVSQTRNLITSLHRSDMGVRVPMSEAEQISFSTK